MISPQHLINTGICGLFCVTLFSLAASKTQNKPVAVSQPVSIGQDYTLHIKTGQDIQQNSSAVWIYDVREVRTLEERDEQARAKRAQFEELFTRSTNISAAEKSQAEDPGAILRRARNAVHRGIDAGTDTSRSQK